MPIGEISGVNTMIKMIRFSRSGTKSLLITDRLNNEDLIIFVHGFRGAPEDTWGDFPEYCETHAAFPGHDIIFYGYRAGRARAAMSGGLLYDAINSFFEENSYVNKNYLLERSKNYNKIYLVGHSLGCVISRYAVLEAIKNNAVWARCAKLIQFAPALNGADIAQLLLRSGFFARAPLGNIANLFLRYYYPCIVDLRTGSEFLTKLLQEVQTRCAESAHAQTIAAILTVYGELESVVDISDYGCDAPYKRIEGRNHSDLVKLDIHEYRQPCEEIGACL
jgi:pimeloyl-ACP methyl ester carboxylesterase